MMDGGMMGGGMMWGMGAFSAVVLILVVLLIGALVKYLFFRAMQMADMKVWAHRS
jgi:hypothetical protein